MSAIRYILTGLLAILSALTSVRAEDIDILSLGMLCRDMSSLKADSKEASEISMSTITCIMQDSEGYIWYGTQTGFCRDDGFSVRRFCIDELGDYPAEANSIVCMVEDKRGRLWLGTQCGTYAFDKQTGTVARVTDYDDADRKTKALAVTHDSTVWIGVGTHIVRCADDGEFLAMYDIPRKERAAEVWDFYVAPDSSLWVSLWHGGVVSASASALVDTASADETFDSLFVERKWPIDTYPTAMVADSLNECMWIGSWGNGVVKYSDEIVEDMHTQNMKVHTLVLDTKRRMLWVGTSDDVYVFSVTGGKLTRVHISAFMSSEKKVFADMMQDHRGNIWVPSYSPRPFVLSYPEVEVARHDVGVVLQNTGHKIMPDLVVYDHGVYWIYQHRTRLALYDPNKKDRVTFMATDAYPTALSTTRCLEPCREGKGVWTSRGGHLIKTWNEDMEIHWREEGAVMPHYISDIYDTGKGMLLIGTEKELLMYDVDEGQATLLVESGGVVRRIVQTIAGEIYFIADNNALRCLDHNHTLHEVLPSDVSVKSMAADSKGDVWVSDAEGNIYRIHSGSREVSQVLAAALPYGESAIALETDKQGHLWLMSEKTVKQYMPQSGLSRLIRYDDCDVSVDCFMTLARNGDDMLIAGMGAMCVVQPCDMVSDSLGDVVPSVVSVMCGDVPGHMVNGKVEMSDRKDVLSVALTTFDHMHCCDGMARFAYRVVGSDQWTYLSPAENVFQIRDLKSGTTSLEIMATDKYGRWGTPKQCLTIHSRLRWYEHVWLYMLLLAVPVGISVYVGRKRRKHDHGDTDDSVALHEPLGPKGDDPAGEPESTSGDELDDRQSDEPLPTIPIKDTLTDADLQFLQKSEELVYKNMDNVDYGVEQLSGDMHMSRMNLYRKIHMLAGVTPSVYIRNLRLKKAAELLKTTSCSVSEISDIVGFASSKYFSRCFKERYGMQPKAWKRTTC